MTSVVNPTKCHTVEKACPAGTIKAVADKSACCPITKCVADYDLSAFAQAQTQAMLLGPSFMSVLSSGGDNDKHLRGHLSSSTNADVNAGAKMSTDASAKSSEGSGSSSTTVTKFMGGRLVGGASSTASTGLALASDYGAYASDRYNALAESYANAIASGISGTIEGCCAGVIDDSSCPTSCPSDQVCDGQGCVYPKDCPCIRNSLRRPVSDIRY